MFYSPELLYFRNNGKFARCWLAATLSEQMFKRIVKLSLQTIDISVLCDEILSRIQGRCNTVNDRCSLYLSSQLMYGAARLLFYQSKQLQDTLFTIYREMCNMGSSRKFDIRLAFDGEIEGPRSEISCDLNIPNAARDLNLITEGFTFVEYKMRDEPNFGALTDYEMEKFLLPQAEDLFLNEIRRFVWDQPQEIGEESIQFPPVAFENFEFDTVQIGIEIESEAAGRKEFLMDVEDVQIKKSATRRKISTKSPPETPVKKRKISSEEVQVPQPSSVDMPLLACAEAPSLVPQVPLAPESVVEPTKVSIEEPSLRTKFAIPHLVSDMQSVLALPRRRRQFVDNETTLSDKEMGKWIADVRAHTTDRRLYDKNVHPANYYFRQPCSMISHGRMAKELVKLFSERMITRPVTENEFSNLDIDLSLPDLQPDETARAQITAKTPERTIEMSSKMGVTAAEIIEYSKISEKMLPIDVIQPKLFEEASRKQIDASLAALQDITIFEGKIEETTEVLEPSLKIHDGAPMSRRSSLKVALTKPELSALLEVHWDQGTTIKGKPNKGLAKFHEIISPDNYTKKDAAYAFYNCLGLHTEKRVVLKQSKPFDTIWIEKCARYSSESSEDTF